jgi:hypothetical protein
VGKVNDVALAVIVGGFGLLGGVITAFLAFLAAAANRKAAVRDQAYASSVGACAEFIGVSHLFLGRKYDLIAALARTKAHHPDDEYLGQHLSQEEFAATIHPTLERFNNAATKAELLAPDAQTAKLVQDMSSLHAATDEMVFNGMNGKIEKDWETKARSLVNQHDKISNQLIQALRAIGAQTTYRELDPKTTTR